MAAAAAKAYNSDSICSSQLTQAANGSRAHTDSLHYPQSSSAECLVFDYIKGAF